ncbi:MAG: pyruvate dehydrogenase complex dihydrolipoamide acetyltransferase [Chthoniobacterales bacterium]
MPDITMPKLSDTMTEGTVVKWHKKTGDKVSAGEVIADVETDKATMEMEAFDDGVLEQIYLQEGQKVNVGGRLAYVRGEGETGPAPEEKKAPAKADATSPKAEATTPVKAGAPAPAPVINNGRVKASPLAKKIAAKKGIDLSRITGTGPGGRIVQADLLNAPTGGGAAAPAAISIPVPTGNGTRIPLSGMRRIIADRLYASKTQIPHFYLTIEIDAEPLMRLRKDINAVQEENGAPKVTVNDFVVMAAAHAAKAHPKVNAAFAGDSVFEYSDINVSVAIAVEEGLVTPVIRNADKLSLRDLSSAIKDFATRARAKKLKPEEYQGGTLTISNLGAYGVDNFSAIINPPQALILAVGAIVKKPVVNAQDKIVVGHTMAITLSADHRVVDGAIGAEYFKTLRSLLENPATMLF